MSKLKNSMKNRISYLESTSAVPTPAIAYALWLEIYVRQGGKITYSSDSNYSQVSYVVNENNVPIQDPSLTYENFGWSRWTPTVEGNLIPENYGSYALDLLIFPDVTNQDFTAARQDWRDGWEFGHTRVKTLLRDDSSLLGLRAETNQTSISTYADIEKIRKSFKIKSSDTLESFVARMNSLHGVSFPTLKQLT